MRSLVSSITGPRRRGRSPPSGREPRRSAARRRGWVGFYSGSVSASALLDFDEIVRPLQPLPPQRVLIGWVYRNHHGWTRPSRKQSSYGAARFCFHFVARFHKIDRYRAAVGSQNAGLDADHSIKRLWVTDLSGGFTMA